MSVYDVLPLIFRLLVPCILFVLVAFFISSAFYKLIYKKILKEQKKFQFINLSYL